jgi:alternate signal-mediated exported protein
MKKTTKGAAAAGVAGILLLGGVGSLAYWTSSQTITGSSITTGTLALGTPTCDTNWTYASGSAGVIGTPVTLIVPGDSITKSCRFTVSATGDHISAVLTAPATVAYTITPANPNTTLKATVATTYDLAGTALVNGAEITNTANGKVLTAKFVVTFPFGTDQTGTPIINGNDTQSLTVNLNSIAVTLKQDQSTGNNPNA